MGTLALSGNVSGNNNTAVGMESGYDGTGSFNTFLGHSAGKSIASGDNNVIIGYSACNNSLNFSVQITYLYWVKW